MTTNKNPMDHHHGHGGGNDGHHGHFILPDKMAFAIWGLLVLGTVITVAVAKFDFGAFNFIIAMAVATVKASLVSLFFMGLKYDRKSNAVIFLTSIVFLAIFMVFVFVDLTTRSERQGEIPAGIAQAAPSAAGGPAKFKKPWVASSEVLAGGKELFNAQCTSCHGAAGKGDGPAAASLNPPPRNFTQAAGWKNGRKPTQIVGTLTKGLNSMPAFASLPMEDRWVLAQYVHSLGPDSDKDSDAELKAAGIDPSKETLSGSAEASISIDQAIQSIAEDGDAKNWKKRARK